MPLVETVRGPVDAAALGRTYMHEHVFVLDPEVAANDPGAWGDEDERVADAASRLQALADQGTRTLVDLTVIGLGRDVRRVRRVAERVPDLNVVVATGCYTYTDVPFAFSQRGPALDRLLGRRVPDPLVDLFVRDITEGIAGTGVRAAMLKCAIDAPGLTRGVERVMRAVAAAHAQTGTPVTVHTHPRRRTGLDVRRVLCEEGGVDPRRVVLGHSGDTTDVDHLTELAEAGFVLGMDRFGLDLAMAPQTRADVVVEMCRRGFAGSMVLSQDAACYIDWVDPEVLRLLPDWHHLHLEEKVLPYLRAHGVTEEQLTTMLVDVPRRVLAGG